MTKRLLHFTALLFCSIALRAQQPDIDPNPKSPFQIVVRDSGTCTEGTWTYNLITKVYKHCGSANDWIVSPWAVGATNPATCAVGELFFNTAASAGSNIYGCTATNTWTAPAYRAIAASDLPNVNVLISTSGPVADPGNASDYQFNNAAGALTFNAPAGVAGLQRCYWNATGKSGAITIQMPASNTVSLNGVDSSSAGTLVSTGALGDAACIVSDATNHWYAYIQHGSWSTT